MTPGAIRELMACFRQPSSKVFRIASVPMTVMGFVFESVVGKIAVASPVLMSSYGMFVLSKGERQGVSPPSCFLLVFLTQVYHRGRGEHKEESQRRTRRADAQPLAGVRTDHDKNR